LHVFGRAPGDLQFCVVEFKSLAPSVRYSNSKYTVTLKPELGVTQGHQNQHEPIRHLWLSINVL